MPREFENVSREVASGAQDVEKSFDALVTSAEKADTAHSKLSDTQKASVQIAKRFSTALGTLDKKLGDQSKDVKSVTSEILLLSKGMDKSVKATKKTTGSVGDLSTQAKKTKNAVDDLEGAMAGFGDEVKKKTRGIDILANQFKKGRDEAGRFADGVGKGSGVMLGAGIAAVFLAGKVTDLLKKFQDGAMDLARFRVEAELFGRSVKGTTAEGLASMRKELSLTREQASEFYSVLGQGTNELGMTAAGLASVASALQSTFGGDPTKRLREYVDLIKELPSVDADINISASMDDEAAAVFGLAKRGKVSTVIDLQAAGLLGGGSPIEMTGEDAALLNEAQQATKASQDIGDWARGFFPDWGPKFTVMADATVKTAAGIGGVIAVTGAAQIFLGREQRRTTKAVEGVKRAITTRGMSGGGGGSGSGRGGISNRVLNKIAKLTKGRGGVLGKVNRGARLARVGLSRGGGAGAKALPKALLGSVKNLAGLTKGLSITTGVFLAAGLSAKFLEKKFEESGNEVGSAASRLGGELADVGGIIAGFATVGSMIPVIGTLLGALIGTLVAVIAKSEAVGAAASAFGKELQGTFTSDMGVELPKFNILVQSAGIALQVFGDATESTGSVFLDNIRTSVKGLKSFGSKAVDVGKKIYMMTIPLGQTITALKAFSASFKSPEYFKALADGGEQADKMASAFEKLSKVSEEYDKKTATNRRALLQSGLALQSQMGKTEAAFASASFELADFRKEVASAKLDNLVNVGGDAEQFSRAMGDASDALRGKFKKTTEALEQRRIDISKDSKLQGVQRQQALQDLHRKELAAVAEFTQGIRELTARFLEAPDILEAGIKGATKMMRTEAALDAGAISSGDLSKAIGGSVSEFGTELSRTLEQSKKALEAEEKALEDLKKAQESAASTLTEQYKNMSEAGKEAIRGISGVTESGGSVSVDPVAAGEAARKARDNVAELTESFDKLKMSLPEASPAKLIAELGVTSSSLGTLQENLAKVRAENKKLADKGKDTTKVWEKEKALQEQIAQATERKIAVEEKLRAQIQSVSDSSFGGKLDVDKAMEDVPSIMAAVNKGSKMTNDELIAAANNGDEMTKVINGLIIATREAGGNFEELGKVTKDLDDAVRAEAAFSSVAEAQKANLLTARTHQEILERRLEIEKKIGEAEALYTRALDTDQVREAERQAKLIGEAAAVAMVTGDGIAGVTAALEHEADLIGKQVSAISASEKGMRDIIAAREAIYEAELAADPKSEKTESALFLMNKSKDALAELQNQRKEVVESIAGVGSGIAKSLESLNDSLTGQRLAANLDFGEALSEFAGFSDDMAGLAREATKVSIQAANERAHMQRKAIKDTLAAEEAQLENRIREADPADKARVREEGRQTLEAKKRTQYAKVETERKKEVLAAASREADLIRQGIDLREEGLEAELDYVDYVGGSFSQMLDIQNKIVGLAKERLTATEDELEMAKAQGVQGNALLAKQIAVDKARFALSKKSMGVQKSTIEKLMGAAFGEIRGAAGAARGRDRTSQLIGVEKSRVYTAAGLPIAAGPEGLKSIEERSFERQFAGGKAGPRKMALGGVEESLRSGKPSGGFVTTATTAAAQNVAAAQRSTASLDSEAGFSARPGFSAVRGSGGEVAGGTGSPTMQIRGELFLRSDNSFIKDQVATLVAEVINTPDVRKALDKDGQMRFTS